MAIAGIRVPWIVGGLKVRWKLIVAPNSFTNVRENVARERVGALFPVMGQDRLVSGCGFYDRDSGIGLLSQFVSGSRHCYAIALKTCLENLLLLGRDPEIFKTQVHIATKP